MSPKSYESVGAVAVFLTCIWPVLRRQLFDNDFSPRVERAFRIFLIVANAVVIFFCIRTIQLAHLDKTIQPSLQWFGLILCSIMLIRHAYKLARPGYEVLRLPDHAQIQEVGGATWISIPEESSRSTAKNHAQEEFSEAILQELIDEFTCPLGPWHPNFSRWLSNSEHLDGRSLHEWIPGRWSPLFWAGAANFLLSEDRRSLDRPDYDGDYHSSIGVAGAILVTLATGDEDLYRRVIAEAETSKSFEKFLAEGYDTYIRFYGSKDIPELEAIYRKVEAGNADSP